MLDCPLTAEQWAVQEINAPDGRQGDRYHAWQKPMEIAERFIRHSTKEGDRVYDPFACTGTFLLAAAKLGRKAYGCEIDESKTLATDDEHSDEPATDDIMNLCSMHWENALQNIIDTLLENGIEPESAVCPQPPFAELAFAYYNKYSHN